MFAVTSVLFTPETEEELIGVGVEGREDVPLPKAFRARTALDPRGACLVDNFRKSYVKYILSNVRRKLIFIVFTLTGVVSGVASIAASGGEVPLLLLLGVGGAERGS